MSTYPRRLGRARTHDIAYNYRMGAGFAGEINRAHPVSVEPCAPSAATPPTAFGQPVVVDPASQGVRPLVATDTALTDVYGVTARPFPFQVASATNYGATPIGAAVVPPTSQPVDVVRSGYVMVPVVGNTVKGGAVNIWIAASAAPHVQGGFEAVVTAGSTITLTNSKTTFNGAPDANGIVELIFNA
jgi:hypothetical protein